VEKDPACAGHSLPSFDAADTPGKGRSSPGRQGPLRPSSHLPRPLGGLLRINEKLCDEKPHENHQNGEVRPLEEPQQELLDDGDLVEKTEITRREILYQCNGRIPRPLVMTEPSIELISEKQGPGEKNEIGQPGQH